MLEPGKQIGAKNSKNYILSSVFFGTKGCVE